MPLAIWLSEPPYLQICAAAQWVHVPDCDRFRRAVGHQFGDEVISDGRTALGIAAGLLTYRPPRVRS